MADKPVGFSNRDAQRIGRTVRTVERLGVPTLGGNSNGRWGSASPLPMYLVNVYGGQHGNNLFGNSGSNGTGRGVYNGVLLKKTDGDIDVGSDLAANFFQSAGETCIVLNLYEVNGAVNNLAEDNQAYEQNLGGIYLCGHIGNQADGTKVMATMALTFVGCTGGAVQDDPDFTATDDTTPTGGD